jgi:preprotein translocase subunit Sec63
MKKLLSAVALAVAFTLATAAPAQAEDKMLGTITKIVVAKDGKSAVATLKDSKTGANVDIFVADDVTLKKFDDHRIGAGDEIKCKYEKKDGKNVATFFKKAGGC